jgi:hypothetical protein
MTKFDLIVQEDKPIFDENGELLNNPFRNMGKRTSLPFHHAFVTENLIPDESLDNLRFFYLNFIGENPLYLGKKTMWQKPHWDSYLKAKILRSFTSNSYEWRISVYGTVWNPKLGCKQNIQRYLEDFDLHYIFWKSNPEKLTEYRNENKNFRFRWVYRIDNHILEMIVLKYFQKADRFWPNQGYLCPINQKQFLHLLDKNERDITLFKNFLEIVPLSFFSFPESNQNLCFITNKFTLTEFKNAISYNNIKKSVQNTFP